MLKPAAAELGLAVDLRMFRRGFATIVDSEGGSLKEIQQQLRHASVATTANVYVQPAPSNVRAMVEKVDRVLGSLAAKDQRPVPILMTPG